MLEWCVEQACSGPAGLYQVNLDTRRIELQIPAVADGRARLTPFFALSPDDTRLYAVLRTAEGTARSNRIGVFDMATAALLASFEVPGLAPINGIALSADGRTLAVTGTPTAPVTDERHRPFEQQLVRIGVDGRNHQVLHSGFLLQQQAWAQTLVWTPDGRYILFGQSGMFGSPAFGQNHVMRVPAAGGTPEPTGLRFQNVRGILSFDPAGTRLTFNAREVFAPELWVLEPVPKR